MKTFDVGQCHHRDANGRLDCREQIVAKRANLCPAHEAIWQKAARARYAANRAANAATPDVDGAAIERSVMAGLKDFQRRTVNHVFKRLYTDDKPIRKFLVADEVGLGKTLVARGLVARAIKHLQKSGVKRIDVIYICSNADIAAQNIRRLNVTERQDFNLSSRITLLPLQLRKLNENGLNFVSFTPGTSFDFGQRTGQAAERALLFRLLEHAWGKKAMDRAGAYRLMRGGKRLDRFRDQVSWTPARVGDGANEIDPALAGSFVDELQKADAASGLRNRFFDLVDVHTRSEPPNSWHQRVEMISELRRLLARSCIAALEPDLIILDEFQRFRHLLEEPNPDDPDDIRSLAHELFAQPDARVLMLSATPYKMYTLSDEADDDHYRDFVQTSSFLLGRAAAAALGQDLTAFRRCMFNIGDGEDLTELVRLKIRIERRLRSVMTRTERLSVTEDRSGMLQQRLAPGLQLQSSDLQSYVFTDQLSRRLGSGDAMEYWKSAPYLPNFMEGYKLVRELRSALERQDQDVVELLRSASANGLLSFQQIRAYEQVDPGNARLRSLMADTLDKDVWQLLWMPPSMPYYEPGPPFDAADLEAFTKRLIFSSWTVAPQAIACLMSYEAERRMVHRTHKRRINTAQARQRQRGLLRFGRDSRNSDRLVGMPVFGLLYPSPTLARIADPLRLASSVTPGRLPTREELIVAVKADLDRRLRPLLRQAKDGPTDENWYWAAAPLLDARSDVDLTHAWLSSADTAAKWDGGETEVGSQADTAFAAHIELARNVIGQAPSFGPPPPDLLEILARLALASPANTALRSLGRALGDPRKVTESPVRDAAARIAWGFRTLFNVPEVMALLRTSEGGDDAYWKAVLEYCFAGNLQAVLDEYLHVLPEWLGLIGRHEEAQLAELAREVHDVVALRAANYGVEEVRQTEKGVSLESQKIRARFALRFGVRASDEAASQHRSTLVRSAFNSPFWPFVLASTSLGQEGLDFHQYCHAVVHWNLPANPVDMEQREGRVHRYKGHAVRKNVALEQSSIGLSSGGRDPWGPMFEAARPPRSTRDRDLVPYWVYAPEGGTQIERYVPALPMSRDAVNLDRMKRSLAAYRLVFGQPRQEDMLAYLGRRMSPDSVMRLADQLRIDLSPR